MEYDLNEKRLNKKPNYSKTNKIYVRISKKKKTEKSSVDLLKYII